MVHVSGRLAPESIRRTLRLHHGRFGGCYQRWLRSHPGQTLRAELRFVIGARGETRSISVPNLEGGAPTTTACLTEAVAAIHFTEPPVDHAGLVMPVTVIYPLVMKPDPGATEPAAWEVTRTHLPAGWRWAID